MQNAGRVIFENVSLKALNGSLKGILEYTRNDGRRIRRSTGTIVANYGKVSFDFPDHASNFVITLVLHPPIKCKLTYSSLNGLHRFVYVDDAYGYAFGWDGHPECQ